jgi:hypothetical protein
MSMGSSFSGGVDRFLLFKKNGSPNILIKNLHLSIQDVISGSLDLKYISDGANFSFLGAGQFDFRAMSLALVAVFEKENSNLRFGMFAAVEISGTGITVFPGINIIKLGGGFFYNPKQEYLDIVMSKTDLNGDSALTALPPIQGELKFAAFLYAGISIVDKTTFEATTLITITDQYIDIAGKAVLLNQDDKLTGTMKFTALFTSFYITGYVDVQAKLGVIEAKGRVDFRLAETQWYLKGSIDGHVINEKFLNASLKFFVGNPGFMVKVEKNTSFDFWIVKVSSKVTGMVWMKWQVPREFGAFFEFRAKAEVLLGLASIEGQVKAILIISDRFILYGEAGGKVCVAWGLKCWEGSIWIKISNKSPKFDGGFGSDPEMAAKIAAAEGMADEMENAANQAQQDLVNKLIQTTQLTDKDIKTAGLNLYAADPEAVTAEWIALENANGGLTSSQSSTINNLRNNYIILPANLKSQSQMLASLINQEKQFIAQAEQMAEVISNRINQGMEDLPSVDQMLQEYAFDSPIQVASDSVQVITYTDAEGHEHQTFQVQPQLQIDNSKVEDHKNRAKEMEETQERILEQIYDRILAMNRNLKQIDFILTGKQGGVSINELGKKFQLAHEKLELYYMEKQEYLFELASFASSKAAGISGLQNTIISFINSKNSGISDINVARNLAKARARALMNLVYLGNPSEAQKAGDSLAVNVDALENINDVKTVCANLGRQLWFEVPSSGLTQLAQSTDTAVVNNIVSRHKAVGALEQRQVQITKAIDQVYDMRIAYAQTLYDLCDRYLYWQLGYTPEIDIDVLGNSPTGTPQGNIVNYIKSHLYPEYQVFSGSLQNASQFTINTGIVMGSTTKTQNNAGGMTKTTGGVTTSPMKGLVQEATSLSDFKGVMDAGRFVHRTDPVFVKIVGDVIKPVHIDVKALRDQLAKQLSAPLITSISVRAFKNPHSGYITASFNAQHPAGIANFAYTITDAYTPPNSGGAGGLILNGNWNTYQPPANQSGPFITSMPATMPLQPTAGPQFKVGGVSQTTGGTLNLKPETGGTRPAKLGNLQGMIIEQAKQDYGVYSTSFKLVGSRTNLNSYFLPLELNETSHEYALKIRARSTGGFVNRRLANFTVEFGGSQRNQQTGSYAMLEDNTPPKVLRVTIPKYQYAMDRIFNIHVEAVDYESDVIEVAYTVSESPTLSQPDSVKWKSVYARRDFNAMDLELQHLHNYYVFVKVKNSVGLWSGPVKSNPVLIDTTSPGAPTITFTASLPDAVPGQLPLNAIVDYGHVSQDLEFKTRGNQVFHINLTPSQQPESSDEEEGGSLFPVFKFVASAISITPDTIPPGIRVHFDPANDPESGIEQYVFKVTGSATDPNPNSGWRVLGVDENGAPKTQIVIVGEPLAYLDSFYVHIRAMNKAGLLGPAVSTGPIRPKDPTKPTKPKVDFGNEYNKPVLYSASTNSIVLGFGKATDNESGIKEYQVKIGTTPGGNDILDWTSDGVSVYFSGQPLGEITEPPALFPSTSGGKSYGLPSGNLGTTNFGGMTFGGSFTLEQPPNRISINNLSLTNGSEVYVAVRAINGDDVYSDESVSEKIVIDNTPPPGPTITPVYDPTNKQLAVTVSNLKDDESGVAKVKIGIKSVNSTNPTKSEVYTGIYVLGRSNKGTVSSRTVTFDLQNLPGTYRYPDRYEIKAVVVNRANLKSPIVTSYIQVGASYQGVTTTTTTPSNLKTTNTGAGYVPNLGNPFSGN